MTNVGYAVAIDLGDKSSPEGSIHPRRKQEVGRRLSLSVMHMLYGYPDFPLGPQITEYSWLYQYQIKLWFYPYANNLHYEGTGECDKCCSESPY